MEPAARAGWRGWLACTLGAARRAAFWSLVAAVPTVVIEELVTESYYPEGRPPMFVVWVVQALYVAFIYFYISFPVFGAALAIKHLARRQRERRDDERTVIL